ncbi:hypothetical protein [Pedobacter sp. PACM 27299]|uniref:hypothetical protein n=1 Tax=Pedobacter sp. PACM 27299 TaxID=1727164 RepID=UPI000AFBFBF4|nr:hypothetical protein [Pedobacter sp. PACM 27299]
MLQILIALFLGFSSPKSDKYNSTSNSPKGNVSTASDTEGEGGHIPPKKPTPPTSN